MVVVVGEVVGEVEGVDRVGVVRVGLALGVPLAVVVSTADVEPVGVVVLTTGVEVPDGTEAVGVPVGEVPGVDEPTEVDEPAEVVVGAVVDQPPVGVVVPLMPSRL